MSLSQKTVRELLNYEPETGILMWRRRDNVSRRWNTRYAYTKAGCIDKNGYRIIRLCGKMHFAHRLIWLYVYGHFPAEEIDHINRCPDDNRLENLRLSTSRQNSWNTGIKKSNTSGFIGVSYCKQAKKWKVSIRKPGKRIHLGFFESKNEAAKAYAEAAHKMRGEFSAIELNEVRQ